MKKELFLLICSPLLLLASDHRVSQRAKQRHKEKREFYQTLSEKKSGLTRTSHTISREGVPDCTDSPRECEKCGLGQKAMFGDASRLLARLANAGITFDSSFTTDMAANPSGGKARGFAYAGSYGLSLNIHNSASKLAFFSSAVWRTGTSLSQRKIGNQFPVQQVFGSQTVKLNELYLSKAFFEEELLFKLGRLDGGNDFFASPIYSHYVNNGFNGNPIAVFFNVPFTAYPNSTWGAYVFTKPYKRLSIKAAVFNANSEIQKAKYHGVNFTFKSTNGALWITEWCALVNQEKEDLGMPGNYKVGYYYLTGTESIFEQKPVKGDSCFYFLFDQMIYRPDGPGSKRGITPFISLLLAPEKQNLFPLFFNFGAVWKGIFKSREEDALSVGYIYGKYSPKLGRSPSGKQNFETVYELNYWAQINKWFYVTPDFQYIVHPRGLNIPNAFVLAVQIGFDLW